MLQAFYQALQTSVFLGTCIRDPDYQGQRLEEDPDVTFLIV